MDWKKHKAIDRIIFGKEYPEVHKWIDEFFPKYQDWEHWKERHHLAAIEEKYPDQTSEEFLSAILHVICDWVAHEREFELPKDKEETLEILSYYNLLTRSEDDES